MLDMMMGDVRSMLMSVINSALALILLIGFVPAYFVMRGREKGLEQEQRDHQLGLKSIILLFQVVCFQQALYGVFLIFNWIFGMISSQGITFAEVRGGIGSLIGAGALFIALEILLKQTNNKEKWYPRKVFYGINLIFTMVYGVMGVIGSFSAFVAFSRGAAFHIPVTMMVVYAPVAFLLAVVQVSVFGSKEPKGKLADGLLGLFGSKVQGFSDQAGVGMAAASMAIDNAASQGVSQPQPGPGSSFGAGGGPEAGASQPGGFGGAQQAQPPAADGAGQAACPGCGGRTRFIAQYNRTWCDGCQRYL